MKKLMFMLFVFVPFTLNAMEQTQPQPAPIMLNTIENQSRPLLQPEFISSTHLPILNPQLSEAQRKLIENILSHKHFERSKAAYYSSWGCGLMGASFSAIGTLALISLAFNDWGAQIIRNGGSAFTAIGAFCFIIMSAILIKQACDRAKANREFNQLLQEGQNLELTAIAQSMAEILEKGYQGQPLCTETCSICIALRKDCPKCGAASNQLAYESGEHKVCTACWNKVCKNCSKCRFMRDDAIRNYLHDAIATQLGHNTDLVQIDIEKIINYMKELLKKQSNAAQDIV